MPAVVVPTVIGPAVRMPGAVMVGRRGLPRNRGLRVRLAGSGRGYIRVAAPIIAIGINLRSHKYGAKILLLWRAGWHNRRNDIAGSRIAVLGSDAPVVEIVAL